MYVFICKIIFFYNEKLNKKKNIAIKNNKDEKIII